MPRLLKSLELNGFKSFAQKTGFDLSHGITAIVGPNGSGKSNIIDAIRWLLGEREAKNLRGGKGEDLIFAGTAKRPRVSQAQAILNFTNDSKFFPVDFTEVSVARVVNRDGNNKYYVNKSEVRLKDVIDFFARARLGARGLVVVTQGNSDMFIRATPLERREMIEEMLGLREYQLKKADAERRLRNTTINLEKAKALADEILPHLRSLKRQTNRWEKRSALQQELQELENAHFGSEFVKIQSARERIEKDIAAHDAMREALEQGKVAAESALKEVEQNQPAERGELFDIKKQINGLLEKRSQLQKALGKLEAQLELSKETGHGELPPASALLELIEKVKLHLESFFVKEPEEFREVIEETLNEIDEVLAVIKKGRGGTGSEKTGRLEAEFKELHTSFTDIERDLAALRAKETSLEKRQEQFYGSYKAAVAAFEKTKDSLDGWASEHREKEFQRERFVMQRDEWERQVRQAERSPEEFQNMPGSERHAKRTGDEERRMVRLRGELASMGEVDESLIKEAKETESRYEFLRKEIEDLREAHDDLRTLIADLEGKIHSEFAIALAHINEEFNKFFDAMFGGGHARLKLESFEKNVLSVGAEGVENVHAGAERDAADEGTPSDDRKEQGIEIDLKLPRRRVTSLGMLSGGEKSLVGIAALFALVSVSPPPFLVLDEVDAPLDDRNAKRFSEMLKEFSKETQFVVVTHNRTTMEAADMLYGITMNEDDTSKVVSLKLE